MLWAGLILILVVFILVWQFAPAIQRWLANVFIDIIVLALTFAAYKRSAALFEKQDI